MFGYLNSYRSPSIRSFPTVSWRFRHGTGESKTHYDAGDGKTLCGVRIPRGRERGDGEMCERCLRVEQAESPYR